MWEIPSHGGGVSWYRIEGKMPRHTKYAPLSDAAFRLSITAGAWCAENLSDGLIPKAMVPTLTAAPRGRALKNSVDALVAANIWEDHGEHWFLHDFLDWNMSREQWQKKVASASAGGAAKAAKRSPSVVPPPLPHGRAPGTPDGLPHTMPDGVPDGLPHALPDLRSPISDLPEQKALPKDHKPDARARGTATAPDPEFPCPKDLRLDEDQFQNLMMAAIPEWAIDLLTTDFLSKKLADKSIVHNLVTWRKFLAMDITDKWRSGKRPQKPIIEGAEQRPPPPDDRAGWVWETDRKPHAWRFDTLRQKRSDEAKAVLAKQIEQETFDWNSVTPAQDEESERF